MSITSRRCAPIPRLTIPQLDANVLSLDFADLGSWNRRDIERVRASLQAATLRSDRNELNVILSARHGGAALVGILTTAHVQARMRGIRLRLHCVTPNVDYILRSCKLDRLIASTE